MMNRFNWAGNYEYNAARFHQPETIERVQELVVQCRTLKVLGTRHSFNGIADSTEDMLSLEKLNHVLTLDKECRTVTIEAGVRYGDLAAYLHSAGYALHNLASLPHISVAGACATATHGSGDRNGNLATAVAGMELVTADGNLVTLSREKDDKTFQGAVVALGGLGVVTKLTLDIVPTFAVRQDVYENLAFAQIDDHFEDIVSSAYSVSLFTDWQSDNFSQVWLKSCNDENPSLTLGDEWYGSARAVKPFHPIANISAENCTQQLGVPGPWHERLPHFKMEYMPSSGEELQTEYFVPRKYAVESIKAIAELKEQLAPLLQISEIRTIAADTLWMSPCYRQDCVTLHFTWIRDWAAVSKLLPIIEAQLAPFQARPHWGKLFTIAPAKLQSLYEELPSFTQLLRSYDPEGKFRNAFLETYF